MATTGWKFPSSNSVVTSGDYSFSNPTNVYNDDTNYSTASGSGDLTDKHLWSNFGFTTSDIPAGSTIDGIEVQCRYSNAGGSIDIDFQLYDGSANVGTAKTRTDAAWSWTEPIQGGAADLWGTTSATLDDSDIRGTGFGVTIEGDHLGSYEETWLDYVKVRVTYTENNDTEVSAAVEALTLTEYAATITHDVNVSASAEALTITEQAATITHNVDVQASAEALTITEHAASLALDKNVTANAEGLTLTEYAASVGLNVDVSAGVTALTIIEYAASLSDNTNVSANVEALSIAGQAATIGYDVEVLANAEALTITGLQASLSEDTIINASVEALTLTEQQATLTFDVEVTAAVESLTITEHAATVVGGTNVEVLAGVEALTLTEYAASFAYDVEVLASDKSFLSLVLTEHSADIVRNIEVEAAAEALTITEYQASFQYNVNVLPPAQELVITPITANVTYVEELRLTDIGTFESDQTNDQFTTPAFTPADNSLLVVIAHFVNNTSGAAEGGVLSDSESLSWTLQDSYTSAVSGRYDAQTQIHTAEVGTAASMTVTFAANGSLYSEASGDSLYITVLNIEGYDTSNPVGGTGNDGRSANSVSDFDPLAIALGVTVPSENIIIGAYTADASGGGSGTPDALHTGGTVHHSQLTGVNDYVYAASYAGVSRTDFALNTGVSSVQGFAAVAIEINRASVVFNTAASVESLVLTPQAASIVYDVNVDASLEALTLTEASATIGLSVDVNAAAEALTINALSALIEAPNSTQVLGTAVALTIAEQQATIVYDVDVLANTASLTINPNLGVVSYIYSVTISANYADLSFTEYQASIQFTYTVWSQEASLTDGWTEEAEVSDNWTPESSLTDSWDEEDSI